MLYNNYVKFLVKFWHDFKLQPDVWLFYGFLLTFTLSVRKVLFFYPINGQFNEWTGIYLYLSDIFLILALFLWGIFILRNKMVSLSTLLETHTEHKTQPHKSSAFLPNRNKLQGIFLTGSIDNIKLWLKQAIICLPLLLVFWSFISILWSENQNIALFKAIKLLEFYFLYLYIIFKFSPFIKGGLKGDFYEDNVYKNPSLPEMPRSISGQACPSLPFTKGEGYCSTWNTSIIFKAILLTFVFIMLFDHYLWDIQQGEIILWLVLGFLAGFKNLENESADY